MADIQQKKRRRTGNGIDVPSKKKKEDRSDKKDKKGKHKALDVLLQVPHSHSEFKLVKASIMMSIPPIFANNPLNGAEEMLDSLVMR